LAYTLGIWDGHDSGAALIEDGKILFAANEERYTKRKLEIKFPYNAISNALEFAGIKPSDVERIAFPTTELTKTISRVFPGQKEAYYKFRRRKMLKPRMERLMHYYKYATTTVGVLPMCDSASKAMISRELRHIGFSKFALVSVDHHAAHAATAAFTSGTDRAIVITLDGLGDGLSGSISILENGKLERKVAIPARDSIGIFYEQVTNLVGMRELEDEGKVMAMADYSFPFAFEENKLKDLYKVEGLQIKAKYGPVKQYQVLDRLLWTMPREQFAYMAQQLMERIEKTLVENAIANFGIDTVLFSGGIMSNVKANMQIRGIDSLKKWYIFPHMGDGGIALGAAMYADYQLKGTHTYEFENAYLGNSYNEDRVLQALKQETNLSYEIDGDRFGHGAELIDNDEYIFWFNGRMEYGPRALGDRSILANAGSDTVKDKLNTFVKQREWYQPFAPSILRSDAEELLEDVKGHDRFMTMAYAIKKDKKEIMKSVVHVDLTARPQMVGEENPDYLSLIKAVKGKTGFGVVLNTSFNIHGSPIVAAPEDALLTMKKTKTRYMFLGEYFVENKEAAK
jgi:carbamoyltransferase